MIELNQASFWGVVAVAMLVLVPLSTARARTWLFAGVNLAFLAVLLGRRSLLLGAAIAVAFVLLQSVGRPRYRGFFAVVTGFGVLGLFLLNKLPWVTDELGLGTLGRVLSAIGYSYVALRLVEVLRAVFEGRHPAPDLPSTINYLLPFHMLAAGPIQAYDEYVQQPAIVKAPTSLDVLVGVERVAKGLFKKFVLAFVLQKLFLTDFHAKGPYLFVELQVFFCWLYLDFSAYSDIAVGIGSLIGVATPENFNRPLLARNMIDFWDRWHMSLSLFIRRNVFIPLQMTLMRKSDARWPLLSAILAIAVSFFLVGLWHGLTIGFLIWGVAQASGLIVARVYGHVLQKRLGTKGLRTYLANPWIRAAAVVVTFEFEACTLLTLFMS
jgi:D-alanyl-lipoteichoic acid acyltransferase DltB (MBOAT superfamily)